MKRICSLSLLSIAAVSALSCSQERKEKPNVLFIAIDDLNDWVGELGGNPQVKTPNMDRLFGQGVLFTNAHCAQAVSTASRNALLSGLHPSTTGWYGSTTEFRKNYDEVMEGNQMLPEYFKNNGYDTYISGKIFHNGDCDYPGKLDDFWTECAPHFWDEMEARLEDDGYGYRGHMFYPFPEGGGQLVKAYGVDTIVNHYMKTNRFYSLCGGPLDKDQMPDKGMYDEQIAEWAVNKLGELKDKKDKPFFLSVGFLRPHVPYTAPRKYFEMYDQDTLALPEIPEDEMSDIPMFGKAVAFGFTPKGDWYDINSVDNAHLELVHAYLSAITFVDEQVGKVLDALEENGLADNTVIVLWGDHGQHLGEKHHFRKQALWEESTRVPLFFSVPGHCVKGGKTDVPASLLDIYPTLLDICGLPANEKNQGSSLVPFIEDTSATKEEPVLISWQYGNFAVRSENWRYIRYRDGSEELYDHRTDPGEHINLAGAPECRAIIEWHKKYIPSDPALPAGMTEWKKADKYDRLMKRWEQNDSIPVWLR